LLSQIEMMSEQKEIFGQPVCYRGVHDSNLGPRLTPCCGRAHPYRLPLSLVRVLRYPTGVRLNLLRRYFVTGLRIQNDAVPTQQKPKRNITKICFSASKLRPLHESLREGNNSLERKEKDKQHRISISVPRKPHLDTSHVQLGDCP
jgi:hypothetical protein